MRTEPSYRALDHTFRVRSDVPEALDVAMALLADLRAPTNGSAAIYELNAGDADRFTISVDGRPLRTVASPMSLVDELLWHANREAIKGERRRVALHAAAVIRDGAAVLIPGPAGSGKTTLAAGLLRDGWRYLTDEAVVIDLETMTVEPYAKPLWMSPASARALAPLSQRLLPPYRGLSRVRVYARPRDLGSSSAIGSWPVTAVVFPVFSAGSPTSIEALGRASALIRLASNAFNLPRFGKRGFEVLAGLVAGASCHGLRVGALSEAVHAVARSTRGDR